MVSAKPKLNAATMKNPQVAFLSWIPTQPPRCLLEMPSTTLAITLEGTLFAFK
jgi:hypothetical protein